MFTRVIAATMYVTRKRTVSVAIRADMRPRGPNVIQPTIAAWDDGVLELVRRLAPGVDVDQVAEGYVEHDERDRDADDAHEPNYPEQRR